MRSSLSLLVVLTLIGCGGGGATDSGQPPPRESDGGSDGGRPDAGQGDGGVDAGPPRCQLDAGPELPRDGGSLVCAPCSSATGCGPNGVCSFLQAATCTGTCALFAEACPSQGPEASRFTVTVEVGSFGCPFRHAEGCDFVHEVDLSTGRVTLSIVLLGSTPVTMAFGSVPTLTPAEIQTASSHELWCLGAEDYFAQRCVSQSQGIRVEADAADAGVVVRWPWRAGQLPPRGLHQATLDVLRAGDSAFRSAGYPWTPQPP